VRLCTLNFAGACATPAALQFFCAFAQGGLFTCNLEAHLCQRVLSYALMPVQMTSNTWAAVG